MNELCGMDRGKSLRDLKQERNLSTLNVRKVSLPVGRRMDGVRRSLKADF